MRKALKRHGRAEVIVTDGLKPYTAAMCELGNEARRDVGRHANNRAENCRREHADIVLNTLRELEPVA